MRAKFIVLAIVCAATAVGGYFVGTVLGICTSGICPSVSPGLQWAGAALGGGVGACFVLGARPDPRACNPQDPPIRVDE